MRAWVVRLDACGFEFWLRMLGTSNRIFVGHKRSTHRELIGATGEALKCY